MSTPHVLVLGGTTEGRDLARALARRRPDLRVTTSLAGRVARPVRPPGDLRVGGFGGAAGLARWLRERDVEVVIDATHPFAARMTDRAAAACAAQEVAYVRLDRPPWTAIAGDRWHHVSSVGEAARVADTLGDRLLVTTGRQEAAAFAGVQAWCLLRSIEPPGPPLPARHELLLDRGPFTLAGERELLRARRIDVLVTKNSGGAATAPKLTAARETGLPVVVVDRAPVPRGVAVAHDVEHALAWLARVLPVTDAALQDPPAGPGVAASATIGG